MVPEKIPNIYNGEKTVIYGLLIEKSKQKGESMKCKATLTGDIIGKKFKFDIPFELTEGGAGEADVSVIHQLAVKGMIQEWQDDEGPFEQKHKKIIELSTDASVVSKYTAYIAVDVAQNKPVSGSMQSYELTATDTLMLSGFNITFSGLPPASRSMGMGYFSGPSPGFSPPPGAPPPSGAPPSRNTYSAFSVPPPPSHSAANFGPQPLLGGGPPPPLSPRGSAVNFGSQPLLGGGPPPPLPPRSAANFEPQPLLGGRLPPPLSPRRSAVNFGPQPLLGRGPPPPPPPSMEDVRVKGSLPMKSLARGHPEPAMPKSMLAPSPAKQTGASFIVSLQQANGSWLLNDQLAGVVSKSVEELKSCCPVSCDDAMMANIWATLVVIELLKKKYPSMLDELELVIMKAEQWLSKQMLPSGINLATLKEHAGKFL